MRRTRLGLMWWTPFVLVTGLIVPSIEGFASKFESDHEDPRRGFRLQLPSESWTPLEPEEIPGDGLKREYRAKNTPGVSMSLIVWELDLVPALKPLLESERSQMANRGKVDLVHDRDQNVPPHRGHATRYRFVEDETPSIIDATYFKADGLLARLAVSAPEDGETLEGLIQQAIESLTWTVPQQSILVDIPHPPTPGNVLTLVTSDQEQDLVFRYLEALPGAAKANAGLPIVLALGDEVHETARAFVRKYRPEAIRLEGPPHSAFPEAIPASTDWPRGDAVVLAPRELQKAIDGACLALRLECPLLLDGPNLTGRLDELAPSKAYVFGTLDSLQNPSSISFEIENLKGAEDVARIAGRTTYLAIANPAHGAPAVLAAPLAAVRHGIVLSLPRPIRRHRLPLAPSDEIPRGFEASEHRGQVLAGLFKTKSGAEIMMAAPRVEDVQVATQSAPRYGRLRLDLNVDGILDPSEVVRVGETMSLEGHLYEVTYHYRHPFVGYLSSELILSDYPTERIRETIIDLADKLGVLEHVAIVGTPDAVPFCYAEAEGYFETYDIKQELATDAPYGNLDEDAYLELAVGRLPFEDLQSGSAILAHTLAYPRLEGEWTSRATMIQPGFHELEGALPWVLPNAEAMIRGIQGDLENREIETQGFYRSDVDIDDVLQSMSNAGWIAYFNHSGPGTWGIHPGASIVTLKGRGRENRPLPTLEGAPIVFGGGCSSAALDVGQPLRGTFPGRFFELGAVAYLGNTRVAYARSEHLVQLFFARLASGATLGQAYRDGRNFLAHLLDGGHLLGHLGYGVEIGSRDFLWGQHAILNLFGDPALKPRLPIQDDPPIDITLENENQDLWTLSIESYAHDRKDPVLMMPASGQGSPREFYVRTGPGMTSNHLPHNFVDDGLSPVRSLPEVPPAAWVDIELPASLRGEIEVTLSEGPVWCDRGFSVVKGAGGERRLVMFVPMIQATFEHGEGQVVDRVCFHVRERGPLGEVTLQKTPRIQAPRSWTRENDTSPLISKEAALVLDRLARAYRREDLSDLAWTMTNPQPRLYGEQAHFEGTWDADGTSSMTLQKANPLLDSRVDTLVGAARKIADLPFASPLPSLEGMSVDVDDVWDLVLRSQDENEDDYFVTLHSNGRVAEILRTQYGISRVTRFHWSQDRGRDILTRVTHFDRVRPEERFEYTIHYDDQLLPASINMMLVGKLPEPLTFVFDIKQAL